MTAVGATADRLRADVEALAGMTRDSAGAGERASAEWAAGRLRELGAEDVRVDAFRYQPTFAYAQGAHFAAGTLAALGGRRLLAAATLASFELDYSGRAQWSRALLPAGDGANAVGRLPARGPRTRTRRARGPSRRRAHRPHVGPPLPRGRGRRGRAERPSRVAGPASRAGPARGRGGRAAHAPRGRRAPGRRSGAHGRSGPEPHGSRGQRQRQRRGRGPARGGRLARERPPGLEVIVLVCGCEESGMGGMAAWMQRGGRAARLRHHARRWASTRWARGSPWCWRRRAASGPSATGRRTWPWPSARPTAPA